MPFKCVLRGLGATADPEVDPEASNDGKRLKSRLSAFDSFLQIIFKIAKS